MKDFAGKWLLQGTLRWGLRLAGGTLLFLLVAFIFFFRGAIYNRYVAFPAQQKALDAIHAQQRPVALKTAWKEFRGVCHSHSYISHDSEMPFEDILAAAKIADLDFIAMTDHTIDDIADYSWQWRGIKDGVLFIPGFEMGYGYMPWGLPEGTQLRKSEEADVLAQQIQDLGGVLFYAHSEEDRLWDSPNYNGMEIYNIHTNIKTKENFLLELGPDMILNRNAYPDLVMRRIFDRQSPIIQHWDELNITRKVTGIAASDAHQNIGARAYYTDDSTVILKETSPNDIGEYGTNFFSRLFLRLVFGKLEPGKQLFRIDLDPYQRSLRYANTHVFAKELTEAAIVDALRNGRAFVGFDMLADARGFVFLAQSDAAQATIGESLPLQDGLKLLAEAPFPCRMRLYHLGRVLHETQGYTLEYTPTETGKYRIEAEFEVAGGWWPWIYTNHLEISHPEPAVVATGNVQAVE